MNMYKKLDCECKHDYRSHLTIAGRETSCIECYCSEYDPVGHNPELENILCPRCRLLRLEKADRIYVCYACQYVMLESQVLELVG
jgi:predicted DNA-binding helix-hairpin-helix protein